MNDASKRKLAEIKARLCAGEGLYRLQKECNEFLLLSFEGWMPNSEKSGNADKATKVGNAWLIDPKDLEAVKNRKPGRPRKARKSAKR
jgi:hypothetical protein